MTLPIVNAGYRSTNYWVIGAGAGRLLVDLGYPGTWGMLTASLKRLGIPLAEIRYGLATHYHIDHAGLAEELKRQGLTLIVLPTQMAAIPLMKQWTKPADRYMEITLRGNVAVTFAASRAWLARIGLAGEIVPTPGHSADSVTLVLDDGAAFTGDLPILAAEGAAAEVAASWQRLRALGVSRIYPGHGPVRALPAADGEPAGA